MPNTNGKQTVRKVVEKLREHLATDLGYTAGTLRTYAAPWDGLVWFAERHGFTEYGEELGERFLSEYYGIPDNPSPQISASRTNINKYTRAIRMIGDFSATGTVSRFSNLPKYEWHSSLGGIFNEFIRHLENIGTRHGTKMVIQYDIARFDRYLVGINLKSLSEVSCELIHEYVLSLSNYKSSSIANILLALKKFLSFIHAEKYVESDLSLKVPRPKALTDYGVPDVFTREETDKVLAAVNRKAAIGKRDYAMLVIGAHLGLRQCDILNLEPANFDVLTETTSLLWTAPRAGETPRNQLNRISAIRTFAVFLMQRGEDAYLCPYPHQKDIQVYQPYIFSRAEVSSIFKAADAMRHDRRSPTLHLTTPVIIKTLYGTGMRISEVLNLKRKNVDLKENCIMAYDTKGGKERLLPISYSLGKVYEEYCSRIRLSAGDYLFAPKGGKAVNLSTFYHTFRVLLEKAGIPHLGRGHGPRIHDLRHTMAVHRLNHWAVAGKDVNVMLPILAVYLGHENVRVSSYYLRLTAQVYPEVTAQFERDFGEVIPDIIMKEREALSDYD